jgi:hypothetical protein
MRLDQYILGTTEETEEYQKFMGKAIRPKRRLMQPGNMLEPEDSSPVPDPKKQSIYLSIVARLHCRSSMQQHDFSSTFRSLWCGVLASVHRQARNTGQHSTT